MTMSQILFNIDEASKILNIKVSRLRTAIFRREIGHIKLNGLVRFSRENLESWINANQVFPL